MVATDFLHIRDGARRLAADANDLPCVVFVADVVAYEASSDAKKAAVIVIIKIGQSPRLILIAVVTACEPRNDSNKETVSLILRQ